MPENPFSVHSYCFKYGARSGVLDTVQERRARYGAANTGFSPLQENKHLAEHNQFQGGNPLKKPVEREINTVGVSWKKRSVTDGRGF